MNEITVTMRYEDESGVSVLMWFDDDARQFMRENGVVNPTVFGFRDEDGATVVIPVSRVYSITASPALVEELT